jgi:putative transcriptional regulator
MINEQKGPNSGDHQLPSKIKALRARLGITQEQFASLLGVTFSTVNRWETGKSRPSPLAIARIEELKHRLKHQP